MTVVLSMINLVPGGMGGSETYARELLRALREKAIDVSTLVSPAAENWSDGVPEVVAPEFPTGRSTVARARGIILGTVRRRALARHVLGAAVIHYPFTVSLPPANSGQRTVVSLLDVQHRDLPELFSRLERGYRSVAYDRAARRADAVITLSEFSKQRIVHHLGIEPARVRVAHLGVRPEEFTSSHEARENFLLYPARAWAHKNHAGLFRAFRHLRRNHPSLRLVLTGATAQELPYLPVGVEARGQVSRDTLVSLYGRAAALVFPSRYEGFGLPIVEAMSSGCPVAAARAGSIPEVVGDAGVLFDSDDELDTALGVEEALDRSAELRQRGVDRARQFNWSACADVHARLYSELGA